MHGALDPHLHTDDCNAIIRALQDCQANTNKIRLGPQDIWFTFLNRRQNTSKRQGQITGAFLLQAGYLI